MSSHVLAKSHLHCFPRPSPRSVSKRVMALGSVDVKRGEDQSLWNGLLNVSQPVLQSVVKSSDGKAQAADKLHDHVPAEEHKKLTGESTVTYCVVGNCNSTAIAFSLVLKLPLMTRAVRVTWSTIDLLRRNPACLCGRKGSMGCRSGV
ncbi:unnamed protein product [Clavelina lepadiformis]|uniref:Uncharacterized protein n=1 Tax=Clavelina lepadiformis TaxID=159417 RepID=A0ABP0FF98_CLALP